MDKQYDYKEPEYLCWWEDTIGVYTEKELYETYKDTNLTPNTTYYYGFFAQDKLNNWSAPSTTSGKTVSY